MVYVVTHSITEDPSEEQEESLYLNRTRTKDSSVVAPPSVYDRSQEVKLTLDEDREESWDESWEEEQGETDDEEERDVDDPRPKKKKKRIKKAVSKIFTTKLLRPSFPKPWQSRSLVDEIEITHSDSSGGDTDTLDVTDDEQEYDGSMETILQKKAKQKKVKEKKAKRKRKFQDVSKLRLPKKSLLGLFLNKRVHKVVPADKETRSRFQIARSSIWMRLQGNRGTGMGDEDTVEQISNGKGLGRSKSNRMDDDDTKTKASDAFSRFRCDQSILSIDSASTSDDSDIFDDNFPLNQELKRARQKRQQKLIELKRVQKSILLAQEERNNRLCFDCGGADHVDVEIPEYLDLNEAAMKRRAKLERQLTRELTEIKGNIRKVKERRRRKVNEWKSFIEQNSDSDLESSDDDMTDADESDSELEDELVDYNYIYGKYGEKPTGAPGEEKKDGVAQATEDRVCADVKVSAATGANAVEDDDDDDDDDISIESSDSELLAALTKMWKEKEEQIARERRAIKQERILMMQTMKEVRRFRTGQSRATKTAMSTLWAPFSVFGNPICDQICFCGRMFDGFIERDLGLSLVFGEIPACGTNNRGSMCACYPNGEDSMDVSDDDINMDGSPSAKPTSSSKRGQKRSRDLHNAANDGGYYEESRGYGIVGDILELPRLILCGACDPVLGAADEEETTEAVVTLEDAKAE